MRSSVPAPTALHVEPEEPSGVEIMDVLWVLWRRRLALAVAFLAVFALGYSAIGLLPIRYSGEVELVLEVAKAKAVDVKSAADQSLPDRPAINSEMDVFRSRGLVEQVVDKLGLTQDPEFNPTAAKETVLSRLMSYLPQPLQARLGGSSKPEEQPSPERIRTKVVNSVQSALKVENDGQSNTVRLYYQATSPTTAAAVANAFADLYLQNDLRYRRGTNENAASWIKSKLKELREQVTKADQAVQAFREQHQIIEVDHGPLIDQQLAELSRELAAASATRMLRQSELEALQRTKGGDRIYNVPRVAASPLVQELRLQQNALLLDRAELGVQLGPLHTRMVEVESSSSRGAGQPRSRSDAGSPRGRDGGSHCACPGSGACQRVGDAEVSTRG